MFSRLCTKAVLSLIALSLITPSILLFYPLPIEADTTSCAAVVAGAIATVIGASTAAKLISVPSSDAGAQAGISSMTGSGFGTFFKDCILTPLAIRLANAMLQNMTYSIVHWINTGFKGNPAFVQNLREYLSNSADQAIGEYLTNDLGAGFLCGSFSLQVKIAIAQSYSPDFYRQRSACTLTDIEQNVDGFTQNDGMGGWKQWIDITTIPQNNIYGSTFLAEDQLQQKLATQQSDQTNQLNWNNGFLSVTTCTRKYADGQCEVMQTDTPGVILENQLNNALDSSQHRLEVANDIDAIIGALSNQLVSQVINGATGLLGAGKGSNGSYGTVSYDKALNPSVDSSLQQAINSGVNQTVNNDNISVLSGNTNTSNLVVGAGVTVSSSFTDPSSNASFLTDGDQATTFVSTNENNPSATIDLGAVKNIGSIAIFAPEPVSDSLGNLSVSISSDGVTYHNIDTENIAVSPFVLSTTTSAEFVRIQKNGSGPLKINEVSVNGPSSQTTSDSNASSTDSTGAAISGVPTLAFKVTTLPTTLTENSHLKYALQITDSQYVNNLTVTMTLKRAGQYVSFGSIFTIPVKITYGDIDSKSVYSDYAANNSSYEFTEVAVDPKTPFVIEIDDAKGSEAASGLYTLTTTVTDSNQTPMQTQSDTFTIQ